MRIRLLVIGAIAVTQSACATPARIENMVAPATADGVAPNSVLAQAICVTEVTGGEETNPLWTSEVDDASFRAALETSLRNNRLAASSADDCRYDLEANLLGLAQPSFGFNMEVTSHVNYSVLERPSGDPYYLTTVTAAYTAPFGDAFLGVTRLRLANEGSIRANIRQFIEELAAYDPPPSPPQGGESGPVSLWIGP